MSSKKKNSEFKIILADDHQVFRIGLRKLIEDAGFTVVAEASNGEELIEQIGKNEDCNMVITDLSMPKMNGLDAIDEIKSTSDDLKIMVLSMHKEREYFRKVLSKGVDGYLLKDDIFEKIVSAIKSVREGRKSYSDELTSFVMEDYAVIKDSEISLELLTKREKEVLVLIAEGYTNKQMAEKLGISVRTVEAHRAHLMDKLDFDNVQELVKFAVSKGLV